MPTCKRGLAAHLAMYLAHVKAELGLSVCILDTDLDSRDVGLRFGVTKPTLLDVANNRALRDDHEKLKGAIVRLEQSGLSVVPVQAPSGPLLPLLHNKAVTLLDQLRAAYDFVVIDTPVGFGVSGDAWEEGILQRVDALVVAVSAESSAFGGTLRYLNSIGSLRGSGVLPESFDTHLVLTGSEEDGSRSLLTQRALDRNLRGVPIVASIPQLWGRRMPSMAAAVDLPVRLDQEFSAIVERADRDQRLRRPASDRSHRPPRRGMMQDVKLRPLSPALGAEVRDVDTGAPLDEATRAELLAALDAHQLLVVPRPNARRRPATRVSPRTFGPPIDELADGNLVGALSNVVPNAAGSGALPFHSDLSFTSSPVIAICLYAVELPPEPTCTWFANSQLAWHTQPEPLRRQLTGRTVSHALAAMAAGGHADAKSARLRARPHDARTQYELPVIHPRTGEPLLYVTDLHAEGFDEMARADSDVLLREAFVHLYSPAHVYAHEWRLGDLLLWDNLALQHPRRDVSDAKPRTFRRVSLNTHRYIDLVPTGPLD